MHSALATEIKECLATLATPLEDGVPVRAAVGAITVESRSRYRVYWGRDGMRSREWFGPVFESPRDAIAFCETVNARAGLVGSRPV